MAGPCRLRLVERRRHGRPRPPRDDRPRRAPQRARRQRRHWPRPLPPRCPTRDPSRPRDELTPQRDPPVRGRRRELARANRARSSRGPWSARGRPPRSIAAARRRQVAGLARSGRGDSNRTARLVGPIGPAAPAARVRSAAGTPRTSSAARPPRWPIRPPAPPTAPGIGTTIPPAAGPGRHQVAPGIADGRRAGIRDERQVRAGGQVLERRQAARESRGHGSWSAASRWRTGRAAVASAGCPRPR